MVRAFVLISFFVCLTACGGDEIYHDLTETQAIQMQVLLETAGVDSKNCGIPRDEVRPTPSSLNDMAKARRLVLDRDLPRQDSKGMAETFSADPGLIPTATQERARLIAALSGEVEEKLKLIPGIVDTHVTVVMPEEDPLRDAEKQPIPPTASVVYRYQPPVGVAAKDVTPPLKEDDARNLVAASVSDSYRTMVVVSRLATSDLLPEPGHEGEVSVLGVRIHSSSRGRFLTIVIGLVGAALLALLGLAWILFGRSRMTDPGEV